MIWISFYVITLLFTLGYTALMLSYTWGWYRTSPFTLDNTVPQTSISVIIPARNEEAKITATLRALFQQNYPTSLWEVIVVDDHSTDKTAKKVQSFHKSNLTLLKLGTLKGNSYSKKGAITEGIKQAKGQLIVTTDADCQPPSSWLRTIAQYYEAQTPKMIAGPVTFTSTNRFFTQFQQLDLLGMIGISGGSIGWGLPQVCNGANLAYEKSAFQQVNGFKGINQLPTGDDVMLMMKFYQYFPGQVHFLKSTSAIIKTTPVYQLRAFLQQRIRWGSKGQYLPDQRVSYILLFVWLFNVLIMGNLLISFLFPHFFPILLAQLMAKLGVEFIFYLFVLHFFRESKLLWLFLPSQLLHIPYIVIVGLLANIKSYSWSGRQFSVH